MRKVIKISCCLGLTFSLLFYAVQPIQASIVKVEKDGNLVLSVLASETSIALKVPESESLRVKEIANIQEAGESSKISLNRDGDKFTLNVVSNGEEKKLDVTNLTDALVEIEERPTVKNIKISLLNGKFIIREGEVSAQTDFPIEVAPEEARIIVTTPSGNRFLAVLPKEALENTLKAKLLNKLVSEGQLVITESSAGELAYQIAGQKTLNLFNLVNYEVDVQVSVSALTGEILTVNQPSWLKVASFIFF